MYVSYAILCGQWHEQRLRQQQRNNTVAYFWTHIYCCYDRIAHNVVSLTEALRSTRAMKALGPDIYASSTPVS